MDAFHKFNAFFGISEGVIWEEYMSIEIIYEYRNQLHANYMFQRAYTTVILDNHIIKYSSKHCTLIINS